MSNFFVKDESVYARDNLYPREHAKAQLITYLKFKGVPDDKIDIALSRIIPEEEPSLVRYNRTNLADKQVETVPLSQHFNDVIQEKHLLMPTFTTYLNKEVKVSFHSALIERRLAWRSEVKQLAFDCEAAGDKIGEEYNNLFQVAIKTGSNSISGIYAVKSTPMLNRTAHSTLTSVTRIATNSVNVALERLLSGTLLFRHDNSAMHYVLALLEEYRCNQAKIDESLLKAGLVIPTPFQVIEYLLENVIKYTRVHKKHIKLKEYIHTLTPNQLAFIFYAGCLWNIAKLNREYITTWINQSMLPPKVVFTDKSKAIKYIKAAHDSISNSAHHLLMESLVSKGNNYYNMDDIDVFNIANTCYHLSEVMTKLANELYPIISVTTAAPNVAYTKEMMRYSVVGGDTDSNIIGLPNWAKWYSGHEFPVPINLKITSIVMIVGGQIIDDVLRQFSIFLGIVGDDINRISMKSEYTLSAVATLGITKTYYQHLLVKEKSVQKKPKLIIKGVHLKNSALPQHMIELATETMDDILASLPNGGLNLIDILTDMSNIEKEVVTSVINREPKYLKLLKIKTAEVYKNENELENQSGWATFWNPRVELPAPFLKIPTRLTNKTNLKTWLTTLPADIYPIVYDWIVSRGKTTLPTIYIPQDLAEASGIPTWIMPIVDYDAIVQDICNILYLIAISLGYYKQKALTITHDLGL